MAGLLGMTAYRLRRRKKPRFLLEWGRRLFGGAEGDGGAVQSSGVAGRKREAERRRQDEELQRREMARLDARRETFRC